MSNLDFQNRVNELIQEVKQLKAFDYSRAEGIIRKFIKLANDYSQYGNQYALEHIGEIENDLEQSKGYKKADLKSRYWNSAIRGLQSDIEGLKSETRIPD